MSLRVNEKYRVKLFLNIKNCHSFFDRLKVEVYHINRTGVVKI